MNHERYKWPGVSGEVRGSYGRWYWMVSVHHHVAHSGVVWRKTTALARMFAHARLYHPDA